MVSDVLILRALTKYSDIAVLGQPLNSWEKKPMHDWTTRTRQHSSLARFSV